LAKCDKISEDFFGLLIKVGWIEDVVPRWEHVLDRARFRRVEFDRSQRPDPTIDVDDVKLSQLATQWSLVLEACRGRGDFVKAAQAELLERYCGAIYRYSLRVLGDADLAGEACQEFALRFVRGDFHHADPTRGRFRDYVKKSVIHLLHEFRRHQIERQRILPLDKWVADVAVSPSPLDTGEFQAHWRKELLNRAWSEMEKRQAPTGSPYYTALRIKADHPDLTAAALANRLEVAGKGVYSSAAIRQVLHRSREVFADLLLAEVARSILSENIDDLAEELVELDLFTYCREALARKRR
jgi:DNA-directed RNA polymerase specialized sigma24 family protein